MSVVNLDGLEDDLPTPARDTRSGCVIGKAAATMPPEDRARFVAWVDGWTGTNVDLAQRITARCLRVSDRNLGHHKLDRCQCREAGLWP